MLESRDLEREAEELWQGMRNPFRAFPDPQFQDSLRLLITHFGCKWKLFHGLQQTNALFEYAFGQIFVRNDALFGNPSG
jgi:hypothetical protein